jgi:hypothetical protein
MERKRLAIGDDSRLEMLRCPQDAVSAHRDEYG